MQRETATRLLLSGLRYGFLLTIGVLFLLLPATEVRGSDSVPASEVSARQLLEATEVQVIGTIVDEYGAEVSGAEVTLGEHSVSSDNSGAFEFTAITRENRLLTVSSDGFRPEFIPLHLFKSDQVQTVVVPPIILRENDAQTVRFLFGGDSAFGRRYLDPDQVSAPTEIPADNPDALIQASDPLPGTKDVMRELKPLFTEADWSSINLETPVTDLPATPHPDKAYVFFTLPQSLDALTWMGLDYVALGNNHLYDYLDTGVTDTIGELDARNIPHSGGGSNSNEAFEPFRQTISGYQYAFFSMTSVTGNQYPINYVASSTKGGAADLTDAQLVDSAIGEEVENDAIPIVQVHGGQEYTFEPSSYLLGKMGQVVSAGARLVIGHHPHVAQGVGKIAGVTVVHSLGNLAFDQDRHETMLGLLARADMRGESLDTLRILPVYIEKYVPRLIPDRFAERFLRRIAEFSHNQGLFLFPYNGQGWVVEDEEAAEAHDRLVVKSITIPEAGSAIIDLRQLLLSSESLMDVSSQNHGLSVEVGRDILIYGDFEDWDLDDERLEVKTWDISGVSRYPTVTDSNSGSASLASTRSADNVSVSITPFRHRVRVMGDAVDQPIKDLSFLGYLKGENAGSIRIAARYYASEGEATFGEEDVVTGYDGTFDWQQVSQTMTMPPDDPSGDPLLNPRAVRLFLYQEPPSVGTGYVYFDDLAIIGWEKVFDLYGSELLQTPHGADFLKVSGPPGEVSLTLTLRSYTPQVRTRAGDLNNSQEVDLDDLILALRVLSNTATQQHISVAGDVNGDQRIGIEEALYILNRVSE